MDKSISEVAIASPIVAGSIFSGVSAESKSALPRESTVATFKNWPAEFTTRFLSSSKNDPFLVYRSWPSADFSGKKPSPVTAKSSVLPDSSILP